MKKRITLFLDLDGVLIVTKPWEQDEIAEDGYSVFKTNLVNNLNKLLQEASFDIVLSSARRKKHPLEEFNKIFKARGISNEIVAYTPISSENKTRKQELEEYILENKIQNFLILDDDTSLNGKIVPSNTKILGFDPFDSDIFLNNFEVIFKEKIVLTKPMLGFTNDKLEEAIKKVHQQILSKSA